MRRKLVLLTRRFTQIAQKVFLRSNRKKKNGEGTSRGTFTRIYTTFHRQFSKRLKKKEKNEVLETKKK